MADLRLSRRIGRSLAVPAISVGLVLAIPGSPAHADCLDYNLNSGVYGTDLVDGEWYYGATLNRDFEDQRQELGNSLCHGCADSVNTDLVVMWQSILFAEGFFGSTSDIDGNFGPNTKNATMKWQSRYGIGVDGKVGGETWAKADDQLVWSWNGNRVYYHPRTGGGSVTLFRGGWLKKYDNGAYRLDQAYSPSGVTKYFTHDNSDCRYRIKFYSRTVR